MQFTLKQLAHFVAAGGGQIMDRARALLHDAEEPKSFAGKLSDQIFGSINAGCFIPLATTSGES